MGDPHRRRKLSTHQMMDDDAQQQTTFCGIMQNTEDNFPNSHPLP
jgi:hypothetical protein